MLSLFNILPQLRKSSSALTPAPLMSEQPFYNDEQQPWAPVAFYSKSLNAAQRKYSTFDCELLGAFLAVKKFHHMLDGREFTLKTDHKSLIPSLMREKASDSDRQQRQLAFLAEMTANFQYIAGPLNAAVDEMSRPPQAEEDSDEVCAVLQEDIPCHWDEQELLAAQQADKETLLAADRLVSTK